MKWFIFITTFFQITALADSSTLSAYIPFTVIQTQFHGKKDKFEPTTSYAETGLGSDYSYYINSDLALIGNGEINLNLSVYSVISMSVGGGAKYYLLGGKRFVESSDFIYASGSSKHNIYTFATMGIRSYDFSSFQKNQECDPTESACKESELESDYYYQGAGGIGYDYDLGNGYRLCVRASASMALGYISRDMFLMGASLGMERSL